MVGCKKVHRHAGCGIAAEDRNRLSSSDDCARKIGTERGIDVQGVRLASIERNGVWNFDCASPNGCGGSDGDNRSVDRACNGQTGAAIERIEDGVFVPENIIIASYGIGR